MDSQRDMYIKEKFQKDKLISKKAEDVFNNFFAKEIKEEQIQEKVTNIDDYRKNRTPKRFMTAVASLAIVLLVGNTYASTQGYDNIFFAIKDWTSNIISEVTKEEILTDNEIIISYQNIEITDKTKIQINKLVVQDNKAKLFIRVNSDKEDNLSKIPMNFIVSDLSNEEELIIGVQKSKLADANAIFTEEINLKGFSENTQRIKVELQTNNNVSLCTLEINLLEKQIDIIDGKKVSFRKISEVDLKEKLNAYIGYKIFLDDFKNEITEENRVEYENEAKLMVVYNLVVNSVNNNTPTFEEVNKAYEEFCGEQVEDYIKTAGVWMKYNPQKNIYDFVEAGDYNPYGLCLSIEDISFVNGEYTAEYIYCIPSESDYLDGTIENLPMKKEIIKFKLNENWKYTEYCMNLEYDKD